MRRIVFSPASSLHSVCSDATAVIDLMCYFFFYFFLASMYVVRNGNITCTSRNKKQINMVRKLNPLHPFA